MEAKHHKSDNEYLDTILSNQTTPETSLIAAILDRALRDAINAQDLKLKYNKIRTHKNKRVALAWIRSKEFYPFSFLWICQYLEFCPVRINKIVDRLVKSNKLYESDSRRRVEPNR